MDTKGIDLTAIPQTAIKVLTSPSAFFREMPKTGGYVEPLVFVLAMGVVSGLMRMVLGILGLSLTSLVWGIASVVVIPIFIAIFGFVGAAIMYIIWKAIGSQENYETAYRCMAYISVITPITTALSLFPIIGSIAGIAISTFFIVTASVETHGINSKKAWTVFGIIGAIIALTSLSSQFAARRAVENATLFRQSIEKSSELMKKQAEEMQKQMQKAK
ncbi:MAG: YIP1 family protein [Nitrospirae bacterium]|nr:YIP1 family protein [Nitrospirota bacterium]